MKCTVKPHGKAGEHNKLLDFLEETIANGDATRMRALLMVAISKMAVGFRSGTISEPVFASVDDSAAEEGFLSRQGQPECQGVVDCCQSVDSEKCWMSGSSLFFCTRTAPLFYPDCDVCDEETLCRGPRGRRCLCRASTPDNTSNPTCSTSSVNIEEMSKRAAAWLAENPAQAVRVVEDTPRWPLERRAKLKAGAERLLQMRGIRAKSWRDVATFVMQTTKGASDHPHRHGHGVLSID